MKFNSAWFQKHQRVLLVLLNLPIIGQVLRRAMWVQNLWRPVTMITPNSVHHWTGMGKRRAELSAGLNHAEGLRASFYPLWAIIHWWDMAIANKHAPRLNLGFDTLLVEAAASYGSVEGINAAYATARSTSSNLYTAGAMYTGQEEKPATAEYSVSRGFLKFDLSSLLPDFSINDVKLRLVATTDASTADFDVQITKLNWSGQDPLSAGNREAAYDAALSADLDAVWRNTSGMSINTQYLSPSLDVTRLTAGGVVYYGTRSAKDEAASPPALNTSEYIALANPGHATASFRPTLVIDYVPSSGWWYFF